MKRILAAMLIAAGATTAQAGSERVVVHKSPTCGCCEGWARHMTMNGYGVETRNVPDDALYALKARLGIAPDHASCHTAVVEGYVIEGHVPAEDVARLLQERPDAIGLSAPGMPIGSPGMEMGDERESYDVILIRRDGSAELFARHN